MNERKVNSNFIVLEKEKYELHVCMTYLHVFGCHMRVKCLRATIRVFHMVQFISSFLGVSFSVKYWLADHFTIKLNCYVVSIYFLIVKLVFHFLLAAFHPSDVFLWISYWLIHKICTAIQPQSYLFKCRSVIEIVTEVVRSGNGITTWLVCTHVHHANRTKSHFGQLSIPQILITDQHYLCVCLVVCPSIILSVHQRSVWLSFLWNILAF